MSFADLGFAKVDLERDARQGAPEAVLAEGKTPGEIEAIVRALRDGGASSVLVTRADEATRAAVRRVDAAAQEHERARCAWIPVAPLAPAGRVAIVSAGTSDGPAVHAVAGLHVGQRRAREPGEESRGQGVAEPPVRRHRARAHARADDEVGS